LAKPSRFKTIKKYNIISSRKIFAMKFAKITMDKKFVNYNIKIEYKKSVVLEIHNANKRVAKQSGHQC